MLPTPGPETLTMVPRTATFCIVLAGTFAGGLASGQHLSNDAQHGELIPAPENAVLGMAELERMAMARNPTLVQAGAQVQISRGKAIQAGLAPNPLVGYAAEQIGAAGTAGEFHGIFFEQQIVTGGKLQLSRAKFFQEARQAELQVLAQRYRILQSVRLSYYDVLMRQGRHEIRRKLLANSEETLVTLKELTNVGQANEVDLLQAQVQLQRARANLKRADRQLQGAREELAAVVGSPELELTALEDRLDIVDQNPIEREAALANLLMCSPQLRFAESEVERDRIGLERERREPIPNINLRAETGYNFEAEDTVAGVEVGLRLPIWDKNQGTILQAQAELTRAQAEVARIELMLRQQFAETFANYEAAMTLATSYRREILPKAEQTYATYVDSFKNRRAAWPQVVNAQREYLELYDEYLDSVHEARDAEVRINTFFLHDGLSQPQEPTPEGHRDATPRPR